MSDFLNYDGGGERETDRTYTWKEILDEAQGMQLGETKTFTLDHIPLPGEIADWAVKIDRGMKEDGAAIMISRVDAQVKLRCYDSR